MAQFASQQVGQKALMDAGLDVPRLFASMIGLSDDPDNGLVVLVFRDGVKAEFQIPNPAGGEPISKSQDVFRTVTSIVLPRKTVMAFVQGALQHFEGQPAPENG